MDPTNSVDINKELLEWFSQNDVGNTSIPPGVITDALAWASRETNSDDAILKLRELANDRSLAQDPSSIIQFVVDQVQKRIFNVKDDRESLRQLAKLFQKHDFIDPVIIKSNELRYRLAEILINFDCTWLTLNISLFDLSEIQRVKIAKLCAQMNGDATAHNIKNFGIQDQKALIEIAELCFQQKPGRSVYSLKNFVIQDPNVLIEIVKLCALRKNNSTAGYIKKFGITDQNTLIEIAKICAHRSPMSLTQKIQDFEIKDQKVLIEIASICAREINGGTVRFIKNFGIQDQQALIEIAKLYAQSNGAATAAGIHNFGITDQKTQREIFAIAFIQSCEALDHLPNRPGAVLHNLTNRQILEEPEKWSLLYLAKDLQRSSDPETRMKIREFFKDNYKNEFEDIMLTKGSKMNWFLSTLFYISLFDNVQEEWTKENGILRNLLNMQRTDLRDRLTQVLFRLSTIAKVSPPTESAKWDSKDSWKSLTNLLYLDLVSQGVDKSVIEEMRKATEKNGSKYHVNYGYNSLIEMLLSLTESKLDVKEKEAVLGKILPEPSLDDIRAINSIFLFGEPKELLQNQTPMKILETLLKEKLSLEEVDGLTEKYFNTFGSSRFPTAVLIYAAKLSDFNDLEAMKSFKSFFTQVLNGTFINERYNTENSIHLKQLEAHHHGILKIWQKGLFGTVNTDSQVQAKQSKQSAKDWLALKLRENHLPIMKEWEVNYVQKYLAGDEKAKQALIQELKTQPRAKQGEFSPLRFQLTLIEYAENDTKKVKETIAILSRLVKSVEGIEQPAFLNDLRGQIKSLQETPIAKEGLMVFDSDDPYDLLLSGTEVYGSCQALDGDPSLNRGILGYLMNGWNRVLKVSTGKDDPFLARCKLQLLWDGEKAVLFRERFYFRGPISEQHQVALNALAWQKANELGVPLLCEDGEGPEYGRTLYALGGPAPCEYSDAAGAGVLQDDGKYSFMSARYL